MRTIHVQRDGYVLIATVDHPDSAMNTIDDEIHKDLAQLFATLREEQQARAVVLTGSGPAFSAGGDYEWFASLQDLSRREWLRNQARRMIWDLLDVEIPIVASLNGHAVGLGASIALLCDVVFMAESARIGDPHVKVGVVAGDGGPVIWPWLVGINRAKQYLLSGDVIDAVEAERIGLVNFVLPDDRVHDAAVAYAHRLAANAPMAVRFTKMAVNKMLKESFERSFELSQGWEMLTFSSSDHVEAVAAIREKRPPEFEGR